MQIHYTNDLELQDEAQALIDFDMGSIRQMILAHRDPEPAVWVAAPEGYQQHGHVLRDSNAIRLIAYVADSGSIYATDGCNSCRHISHVEKSTQSELKTLSGTAQLPIDMLKLLNQLVANRTKS